MQPPCSNMTVRQDAVSEQAALATGNATTAAEVGDRTGSKHPLLNAGASIAGQAKTHGLSAEALAHADRVAHAARTLLHNDSDDEPPADPLQMDAAVKSVPIMGTESGAAVTEAALSHSSNEWAGADAAAVNPLQPALTHMDRRHDVARRVPDRIPREFSAPVAGLPPPSSLQNGGGSGHAHVGAEAEVIATHQDAMELTLKLSSSSEGPAAADRAPGSANAAAIAGAFGSAVRLTAPSQPPLTLLLTPASSPTQSSAELGASAAAGTATGEPLTLMLSPGSSREQGSREQPVGATAGGADASADARNAGALQLALSSSSGQAQHARSAGGSGEPVNAPSSAPSMPSNEAAAPQTSQPRYSSVDCSAPQLDAASSASAQHSAGQQSATPAHVAQAPPSDDGARGPGPSAGTPGGTIPTPTTSVIAVNLAPPAPAQSRTPEESPLHLAQRTPGPAPLSRVPPTPHTSSAALRAALAPEATPGGGSRGREFAAGGPAARPARRRVSSLLARASTDPASMPQDGGSHAAAHRSRPTATGGARRWGQQGDLPTLAESVIGPGTVRLRNPPPTQVRRILRKHCKPSAV